MSSFASRRLRVASQMDPIDRIDIRGDSTFALLLEAQSRGHDLFYYLPQALTLDGNRLHARGETLAVTDQAGAHYALSEPRVEDLASFDVVLLRQDPPFDMAYITSTHLLERIHPRTIRARYAMRRKSCGCSTSST
jgi:glutathione synthase